jgi:hypothetical protein
MSPAPTGATPSTPATPFAGPGPSASPCRRKVERWRSPTCRHPSAGPSAPPPHCPDLEQVGLGDDLLTGRRVVRTWAWSSLGASGFGSLNQQTKFVETSAGTAVDPAPVGRGARRPLLVPVSDDDSGSPGAGTRTRPDETGVGRQHPARGSSSATDRRTPDRSRRGPRAGRSWIRR